MNKSIVNGIMGTLIAAAIIANATMLWRFNERLTNIEVTLGYINKRMEQKGI